MKKFLVVLLSLGLIAAFGMTASATDVKFSGTYYVVGVHDSNSQLADEGPSRAFFYQRIRIQPVFQIAEGLTFTARMDAMEKQWGQTDWRGGFDDKNSSRRQTITNNPKIQESFEWERGYVGFKTALGMVQAGFMASGAWGTEFGDDTQSRPRLRFDSAAGPFKYGIVYEKEFESDTSSTAGYAGKADADNDTLALYGIYSWKGGNAGLLYKYFDRRANRVGANPNRSKWHAFIPYFKATFGSVYMEGEVGYGTGKLNEYETPSTSADKDISFLGAYLMAKANLGPGYIGAKVLFSQGDDNPLDTDVKTGPASQDLDFGLILGNDALTTWEANNGVGSGNANGASPMGGEKQNVIMYSIFGGFKVTPKLSMEAMLVMASRDKVAANAVSKKLGTEIDVTATYKIYDNLSYMVGAGYLMAGDYYKGTNSANKVGDDYLLMNKLSLSF